MTPEFSSRLPHATRDHRIATLPILVLFPHNRCNCRCVMCDIWRIRQTREITAADLERHRESLRALGVKWVVLSGGEPLMHSDLGALCRLLREDGVRITILSTGILLKPRAQFVADFVDDATVSLDGPAEIHDLIRNLPNAFSRLAGGVKAIRDLRPGMVVTGRCTVQKTNHTRLRDTVAAARQIGLNSISFLPADVTSSAFNRPDGWTPERQQTVALNANEVEELHAEIEALIRENSADIASNFVVEGPQKLRRIGLHFRAHLGQAPFTSPRCNAPWVSTVIESDGTVRPCFFHPALGSLSDAPLQAILNSNRALKFREDLDVQTNPVCQRCVCSLYLPPEEAAGVDRALRQAELIGT